MQKLFFEEMGCKNRDGSWTGRDLFAISVPFCVSLFFDNMGR